MDPLVGGSVIGLAGDVIGGFMGSNNTASTNAANAEINRKNIALQREFAQHGIRWRVEDAKRSGIAPLAALGASTTSYSAATHGMERDESLPQMARNMGQDISRAVSATATVGEKLLMQEQIKSAQLENEHKGLQIEQLRKTLGPPGAGNSLSHPGSRGNTAEILQGSTWYWGPDGESIHLVPSDKVKQLIEDDAAQQTVFNNAAAQAMMGGYQPGAEALPPGRNHWKFDKKRMGLRPAFPTTHTRKYQDRIGPVPGIPSKKKRRYYGF